MSLNATSATHIHSDIWSLIQESEKLAEDALETVSNVSAVRSALWALCVFSSPGRVVLHRGTWARMQWLQLMLVSILFWWDLFKASVIM